jgi:hypothetical protein
MSNDQNQIQMELPFKSVRATPSLCLPYLHHEAYLPSRLPTSELLEGSLERRPEGREGGTDAHVRGGEGAREGADLSMNPVLDDLPVDLSDLPVELSWMIYL